MDFPIQMFGGTKNFLPQALTAWERGAEADEAKREEDIRVDEQLCRERDERERRWRVGELRASLSDELLAMLKRHAEEALAAEGGNARGLGMRSW